MTEKISVTRQAVLSLLATRGTLNGPILAPHLTRMQRTQPKRPVRKASKYLRDLARKGLAERLVSPAGMPSTFAITEQGKQWLEANR
jgi:hypothetical protein